MNDLSSQSPSGDSDDQLLDSILIEFDQRRHEGDPISIAACLPRVPEPMRRELLCELIKIDLEYRWKRGQHRLVEEYAVEFPQLGDIHRLPSELIEEEIYCRQRFESNPDFSEIQKRFPERASQFRKLIDSPSESARETKNRKSLSSLINEQTGGGPDDDGEAKQTADRTLGGRFELKDRLGQGAFATVYRAWDKVLQRPVAVKIARGALANDEAMAQRFLREAQSAARLEHPGIVSVYEVDEQDDQFYMVQELIQGGTLADQIEQQLPDFRRVSELMAEICTAMDYAHRCGIVHRDLKPANIMMDCDDHPRIADFGLATQADSSLTLTQEGDLLGTPAYMAPEQARGDHKNVGQAADIYSAGVMLYQLLCGQLPFTGDPVSVITKVVSEEPVAPKKIRRAVPIDLQTICLKAMEKDAVRRYRSAAAMAEDLNRFLNNEPIAARPTGAVEQLWKWCKRRPALATTLAASLVLLSTLAIASYISISKERDRFRVQRDIARRETDRANEETERANEETIRANDETVRANVALFEALTNNVENELRNRETGWHDKAYAAIKEAAALEIPNRDPARLRELAIELLTDTSVRLEFDRAWQPHRSGLTVMSIAISDSGEFAGFAFNDGIVRLTAFDDPNLNVRLTGCDGIMRHLVLDNELRWAAGLADEQIWFWELPEDLRAAGKTNIQGRVLPHDKCTAYSISPDQSLIAMGYESGDLVTCEFADGDIGAVLNELVQHTATVNHIDFSADNLLLCSASYDGFVIQWDLSRDSIVNSWNNADRIECVRFGNTEQQLLFSDNSSFSYKTWSPGGRPQNYPSNGIVRQAIFLQNGLVATASFDGALRLWSRGNLQTEVKGLEELYSIAGGPDDQFLLIGNRGGVVRKFDIARDRIARDFTASHRCTIDSNGALHTETERRPLNTDADPRRYEIHDVSTIAEDTTHQVLLAGTLQGNLIRHDLDSAENTTIRDIHEHPIVQIVLALDDSWYASIDQSGRACFHDAGSHELMHEIQFDVGQVTTVAASMDGKWLVAGGRRGYQIMDVSDDEFRLRTVIQQYQTRAAATFGEDCLLLSRPNGDIDVRDVTGKKIQRKLHGHSKPVTAMMFAWDGKSLYTASDDKRLIQWNWPNGEQLTSTDTIHPVLSFAADPKNEFLVTTTVGNCQLRDLQNLQVRVQTRFRGIHTGGHHFGVEGKNFWLGSSGVIRFSRNLIRRIFQRGEKSGQAVFLNVTNGRKTIPGGYSNQVWGLAVANEQPWMAITDHDGRVVIYDTNTGRQLEMLKGHDPVVWSASFSHDAAHLATGGARNGKGEVIIWDTNRWKIHRQISIGKQLTSCVSFHPQLPLVVAGTYGGTVDLIDATSGKVIQKIFRLHGRVDDCRFSPDGSQLLVACGSDGVYVWDVVVEAENKLRLSNDPIVFHAGGEQHRAAAFSSDGNEIVIGSENGTVRVYRLQTGELILKINGGPQRIRQVSISPDDRFLACSGYAAGGRVWDLQKLLDELKQLELIAD